MHSELRSEGVTGMSRKQAYSSFALTALPLYYSFTGLRQHKINRELISTTKKNHIFAYSVFPFEVVVKWSNVLVLRIKTTLVNDNDNDNDFSSETWNYPEDT